MAGKWTVGVVLACALSCGDSESAEAGDGSGEASAEGSGSTTATSTVSTTTAGTSGTTTATTTSDAESGGDATTGELPDNCGWNGSAYVCGGQGVDPGGRPLPCPDLRIGGGCMATDSLQSCCDAEGNAWACVCDGQACDYHWQTVDCAHGPGAGACGWWSDAGAYSCGGEGMDPGGTPMACPDGVEPGVACFTGTRQPTPCCDANGDLWTCFPGENGTEDTWGVTDC